MLPNVRLAPSPWRLAPPPRLGIEFPTNALNEKFWAKNESANGSRGGSGTSTEGVHSYRDRQEQMSCELRQS